MEVLTHPLFMFSVYATACYFLTLFVRRVVETADPSLKKQADANSHKITYLSSASRWWNEVILYSISPVFGVLLALTLHGTEYFPEKFDNSYSVTIIFGLVCGFTSSWFYKIYKKTLSRAGGLEEEELDIKVKDPALPEAVSATDAESKDG